MPVSGVPGEGSSRSPAAGDGRSVLSLLGIGVAAAPRSPLSGGVCGLVCVRYTQLPAMSGSASLREQV